MTKKIFRVVDDGDFNPDDDLLPEYDLRSLNVVARGPGRRQPVTVELAPEVADFFPDAEAVNEALRTMIRLMSPQKAGQEARTR